MTTDQRALLVAASSEVLLVRATSGRPTPIDLGVDALVLIVLMATSRWEPGANIQRTATGGLILSILIFPSLQADAAQGMLGLCAGLLIATWLIVDKDRIRAATGGLLVAVAVASTIEPPQTWTDRLFWAVAVTALGAAARTRAWPAAGLAWIAGLVEVPARGEDPDVVLVTVDAMRADTARQLPTWRRLTTEGATVWNGWTPSTWTLPAMAALHTGTDNHGAGRSATGFVGPRPELPTLAGAFQAAGWHTSAWLGANAFVGQTWHMVGGFDEVSHPFAATANPLPRGAGPHQPARPLLARLMPRAPAPRDADDLVHAALAQLGEGGPQFLWIHLMDLHLPYAEPPCRSEVLGVAGARALMVDDPWWTSVEGQTCWRLAVDATAARVDRALARLVEGLPPDAVLIWTADHGEALGDAGIEHGHSVLPVVSQIPILVRASPRWPCTTEPVDLIDLGATLAGVARARLSGPGRDLRQPIGPRPLRVVADLYPGGEATHGVVHDEVLQVHGATGVVRTIPLGSQPPCPARPP